MEMLLWKKIFVSRIQKILLFMDCKGYFSPTTSATVGGTTTSEFRSKKVGAVVGHFPKRVLPSKGPEVVLMLKYPFPVLRMLGITDNDWADMYWDFHSILENAFSFVDLEYMLMEFCRGLLKAGKFSLARNYLKGSGSLVLPTDKAENIVILAAREYFFSASSLSSSEVSRVCSILFYQGLLQEIANILLCIYCNPSHFHFFLL